MEINKLIESIEEMDYEEQAKEFLKSTNTELKIEFLKVGVNPLWEDGAKRNIYQCTLINKKHNYTFKFYDSAFNYENKNVLFPTAYDILSCLTKYEIGTFKDFVNEFGYDVGKEKNDGDTYKIYTGCKSEYSNLIQLFTDEEMECLQMIN